jgi:hypothetical protein
VRYGYPFRRIPLTQNKYAIVDPEDYEKLAKYRWHINRGRGTFYAARCQWDRKEQKTKSIKMHREIMKIEDGLYVDHINGNGLDNRKANLRAVTIMENSWNMKKVRRKCWSRYKGVTWNSRRRKWIAQAMAGGEVNYLGGFDVEREAAKAYDEKARELFGEYAALNFGANRQILRSWAVVACERFCLLWRRRVINIAGKSGSIFRAVFRKRRKKDV